MVFRARSRSERPEPTAKLNLYSEPLVTSGGTASGVGRPQEVTRWWFELESEVGAGVLLGAVSVISGA